MPALLSGHAEKVGVAFMVASDTDALSVALCCAAAALLDAEAAELAEDDDPPAAFAWFAEVVADDAACPARLPALLA